MRTLICMGMLLGAGLTLVHSAMAQSTARPSAPLVSKELVLSGNDWKLGSFEMDEGEKRGAFLPLFDDHAFRTVVVPGEVQRQIGLRDMDLYHQSKALTLVNTKEWWYRKEFTISKNQSGKLVRLIFDGVDYFASVWLNGEKLGEHEGTYVSFSYDVTTKIRFGEVNVLAVKVTCPWTPKGRGFLEYMKGNWTALDRENQMHIDQPPFFFGPYWDGIPADGNAAFPMGIWRDVRLASSGSQVIEDLFVSTKSINADGSATIAISGTIGNYGASDVSATLNVKVTPENFSGQSVLLPPHTARLRPGDNSVSLETVIKDAHLWWTWDTGDPNLYKLAGTLSVGPSNSETREILFGIRTISIKPDMSYWLNGKKLFLKGAWYPMSDYYGSKPTRETFLKDLQLFKAANLNHLVAFTVVEKPDFYEQCDRLGILEIFEFPFNQDGPVDVLSFSNPRREAFVQESLRQVRQIILALRNHPSIVEWAAFAEAHAKGGGWGIGGWDFEQYGYGPYSEAIGKLVAELAPGTVYHPSLCDMGEQHFWMGNAGMGNTDAYNQHFRAHTGFVSEYGSISLPVLESWQKELTPQDMWSPGEKEDLPRWHNLPINISAYSYLSSFDYDGVASLLDRVNQYVDRHIRSIQDLVDDSQLYQAFLMRYATESYRRKKYEPVNGTRFWDYGEVWPGIRWGIIDYFRVPKMSYYAVKQAQARFAVSIAYEEALESQPSGTRLQIPVFALNDYPTELRVNLQAQIQDLSGHVVWSKDFDGSVPADGKEEMGIVEWTTPYAPGVYVLRAQASADDSRLQAATSTFIKVTPGLFAKPLRVLLIGRQKYSTPIAAMIRATGSKVDVIDERSLERLDRLSDSARLRQNYDVVWLASFDSFWKFLEDREAEGLKQAVSSGVGFIHTGGRSSFHGGFGEAACLDFTPLADMLPVKLYARYDLVLGQAEQRTNMFSEFSPLKEVRLSDAAKGSWTDSGLSAFGVLGFNETELKPGAREVLSVAGHPLLAVGEYGKGHVLAFTGFTPAYREEHADWDTKVVYPYLLDQELYRAPSTKAYFQLFMQLLAHASGDKPQIDYDSLVSAREKPLFESLKDLASTELQVPQEAKFTKQANDRFHFSFRLANGGRYARLLRVHAEWDKPYSAPYLLLLNDNYFDLAPGESRTVEGTALFPEGQIAPNSGKLIVEGTNVTRKEVMISLVTEQ